MEPVNKNYFVSSNLLIVIIFLFHLSLAIEFSYKNESSWADEYPECEGLHQSPVKIGYKELENKNSNAMFTKANLDIKPSGAKLLNTGHSLKVTFDWGENQPTYITDGPLKRNEYVLDAMGFHWSRVSNQGAEHILFGKAAAMEIHFVHYNRKYGSVENAMNFEDGLAIIGILFDTDIQPEPQQRDDDDDQYKLALAASLTSPVVDQILDNIEAVRTPGSSVDIEPFAISEMRPVQINKSTYISYPGSWVVPPCTENVIWLLSAYPYKITKEQLEHLQSTVEFDHEDDHNNRPVQPMNDRKASIVSGFVKTN